MDKKTKNMSPLVIGWKERNGEEEEEEYGNEDSDPLEEEDSTQFVTTDEPLADDNEHDLLADEAEVDTTEIKQEIIESVEASELLLPDAAGARAKKRKIEEVEGSGDPLEGPPEKR